MQCIFSFFHTLMTLVCFCCLCSGGIAAAASNTIYNNERYGFTVQWPQGAYTVTEAHNGDGVTLTDDQGLTAKVYGTMSYSVMAQDFAGMEADLRSWLDNVTLQRKLGKDNLVLSGYKGTNILYIKALYSSDDVCILLLEYPRAAKERYDALVTTMSKSFARMSGPADSLSVSTGLSGGSDAALPAPAEAQDAAGMPQCSNPAWLKKLLGKHNISLQWIGWDTFGTAVVKKKDGQVIISGKQQNGNDYVTIEGRITRVEARSFTMEGSVVTRVSYNNNGKECVRSGSLTFTAKGKRKYWRMDSMQSPCEEIFDYVDVFF